MFQALPVKLRLPIINLSRKKWRTLFAVCALASGGVIFMTAQNIAASIDKTVDENLETFKYDYDISLAGFTPPEKLENLLAKNNHVAGYELYVSDRARFINNKKEKTPLYEIKIFPADSSLFALPKTEENFSKNDAAIFITQGLWDVESELYPGTTTILSLGNIEQSVRISGIIREIPPFPIIYMNEEIYSRFFNLGGGKQNLLITSQKDANGFPLLTKQEIEELFSSQGIHIAENWNVQLLREVFREHLKVIINFLSIIALLAILVGGLSIASIIGISISERKRELGIQRAIGASPFYIGGMIVIEALCIGLAGWGLGVLLSYPLSIVTGNYFGNIFFHANLQNTLSMNGMIIWLILSLLVSALFSIIPVRKSLQAKLATILSYE